MFTVAIVIDDTIVNWVMGICAVALPTVGTTIVFLWNKLIAWLRPMVEQFFAKQRVTHDAQTQMANKISEQVPVMTATLTKLGETQDKQCETLAKHTEQLDLHGQILKELHQSNADRKAEGS